MKQARKQMSAVFDAKLSLLQDDYHDIVKQYHDERQRYDQIEAALNATDDGPWLNCARPRRRARQRQRLCAEDRLPRRAADERS